MNALELPLSVAWYALRTGRSVGLRGADHHHHVTCGIDRQPVGDVVSLAAEVGAPDQCAVRRDFGDKRVGRSPRVGCKAPEVTGRAVELVCPVT